MDKALRRKPQCFPRKSRLKRRRAQNIIYHKSPNACGQAQNKFTLHSKNKNKNNELYKTRNKTRHSLNSMQTRAVCFTWNRKGVLLSYWESRLPYGAPFALDLFHVEQVCRIVVTIESLLLHTEFCFTWNTGHDVRASDVCEDLRAALFS